MKNIETKDYVAYEYMSINVESINEPLYIDCYESFGWILVNNTGLIDKEDYFINNANVNNKKLVNLKFKRDRKIKNKVMLNDLQRQLEKALKEIDRLISEPNRKGIISSLGIGLFGTIFLAISVFSIVGDKIYYIPFILGGILGLIGWILPYFIYKRVKDSKEKENISLIDEQYNVVYDTCEQANKLTN